MNRRVLLLLAASLLLALIVGQINHYLGAFQLHVWVGGLFVTFVALRLSFGTGAFACFLAGLLLDSTTPVPFGTQGLLFLTAHAVIFNIRARAPREETVIGIVIALVANLGLFIALSFLRLDSSTETGGMWMRIFSDLLVSQIALTVLGPWFFGVQTRLLQLGNNNNTRDYSRRSF